ncbi:hypothetical protein IMZ29_11645 [Achromobacter sp. GG226]|uniref:S8 family serine peptidase n=1 Tax=Verticiella alkaliphila TaxID=2779529 RepID=UPI001C0E3A12|nr:hypothetical protein [Verticiella sp. GG226]MBU4611161.1 hypothetical protein [Verticiella sp. GG226]
MPASFPRRRLAGLRPLVLCGLAATVLSGCAWMPTWMGGERGVRAPASPPAAETTNLVVVQYRQGPRSFGAQTANDAVGVRMVQTLGVIDGALVAPPEGMSAEEASRRLREQPDVINAQPHVPRR